jgi:hypothetical protein
MLSLRKNRSDDCHDPGATVGVHHQDTLRVQSSTNQLSEQRLPSLMARLVTLDETKVLPLSLLRDPYSTQGRSSVDSFPAHFEVGPANKERSKLPGDRPIQPPDQLPLDALVHSAHFGRTQIAAREQMRDFPNLASGDSSEKHLRDDLVDPLVLSSVLGQNIAVRRSRLPAPGHAQILNETEAGFELPWPRPVAAIFSQKKSVVTLGTGESQQLVLRDPFQELSDAFEQPCGLTQATRARDLIDGLFSC